MSSQNVQHVDSCFPLLFKQTPSHISIDLLAETLQYNYVYVHCGFTK